MPTTDSPYGGTIPEAPTTTVVEVPPTQPAQPELATTGSSVLVPALLGGIFLAAVGAALLRWARSRMPSLVVAGYTGTAYPGTSSEVSDGTWA